MSEFQTYKTTPVLPLPDFASLNPDNFVSAIETQIQKNQEKLDQILTQPPSFNNTLIPLEEAEDCLSRLFAPIRHLHSVLNQDKIRAVFDTVLQKITAHQIALSQNTKLFQHYENIKNSPDFKQLSKIQQKIILDSIRDFKLSGVHLPEAQKKRLAEIAQQLSELATQFENHIIDATNQFKYHTETPEDLAGLPESTLAAAREKAIEEKKTGFSLGLDFPTYFSIMTYAESTKLREFFYHAYSTRAPLNGPLITKILQLRHEEAQILGFKTYADLSLATKMADSPQVVLDFLNQLAKKTRPFAIEELKTLKKFIGLPENLEIQPWDLGFYSEKLSLAEYELSQETLRPYFPIQKVLMGLFELISTLFEIDLVPEETSTWHRDVLFFRLEQNNLNNLNNSNTLGYLYLDLYARENKREGAWMDECVERRIKLDGSIQKPVAFLTCNFMPPLKNKSAYLTHDDVITLFHEMGHCLHHLLTQMEYSAISGINNVPWDAVELPSQFLENFAWTWEVLSNISQHEITNLPIEYSLFERLTKTRQFQAGLNMLRQLEFSLFDFTLHAQNQNQNQNQNQDQDQDQDQDQTSPDNFFSEQAVQDLLNKIRKQYALIQPPAYNKFQHTFSHIFAGGYAAGYYSYKWAEVLSSDAFSRFEEEGLFDPKIGKDFLNHILAKGGSEDPNILFKNFRGRAPSDDALLRHAGLLKKTNKT